MIPIAELIIDIGILLIAAGGFIVSVKRLNALHEATNSKMDLLIAEIRKSSFAAGEQAEKDRQR